eukprot:CAMPEP_0195507906 /NCGR_PEP_ID=MMETSP0794_2-20130614/1254_1 /TAXON_ID=515487 /ORGANISM="Stephanopyxis turris, Strain CCMP 815" /LENGTH=898 /DNA_ID=CAMNT_0040634737 /DNA_START=94 /DNA_END=2790 /DNA_ORIENTATION=-
MNDPSSTSSCNETSESRVSHRRKSFLLLRRIMWTLSHTVLAVLWLGLLASYSGDYFLNAYVTPLLEQVEFESFEEEEERGQQQQEQRNKLTYYPRLCNARDDLTAHTLEEITLSVDDDDGFGDPKELTELVMTHGVATLPGLLSANTAYNLREAILDMNAENGAMEETDVINKPKNRWLVKPNPNRAFPTANIDEDNDSEDHEYVIQKALKEIASHSTLRTTLQDIMGENPAIVELHAITSEPGAQSQDWHPDTMSDRSHVLYARTYTPLYSVFVALQDTTEEMGATCVCPGSHMCSDFTNKFDEKRDEENDDYCFHAEMASGAGLIYNSQLTHRGGANVAWDRWGENSTRVMFILSFTSRPVSIPARWNLRYDVEKKKKDGVVLADPRFLPIGSTFSIRWDMLGQTLDDMLTVDRLKWGPFTSLGLYKPSTGVDREWGWNYLMVAIAWELDNGDQWYFQKIKLMKYALTLSTINLVAIVFYVVFMTTKFQRQHDAEPTTTEPTIRRMFAFYADSAMVMVMLFWLLSNTEWARFVVTQNRFRVIPFATPHELSPIALTDDPQSASKDAQMKYLVEVPESSDILFGDRMDAFYLHKQSDFYDYHPGNRFLMHLLQAAQPQYSKCQPQLKSIFIQSQIIDLLYDEQYLFLQHDTTGDWARMNNGEVLEKLRTLILHQSGKAGAALKAVSREMDFIMSQCKYGDGGRTRTTKGNNVLRIDGTVMSTKFIPNLIHSLRLRVYREEGYSPGWDQSITKNYMRALRNPNYGTAGKIQQNGTFRRTRMTTLPLPKSEVHDAVQFPTSLAQHPKNASNKKSNSKVKLLQIQTKRFGVTQQIQPLDENSSKVLEDMFRHMEGRRTRQTMCVNRHEKCVFWAANGQCEKNPSPMKKNCSPACRFCGRS